MAKIVTQQNVAEQDHNVPPRQDQTAVADGAEFGQPGSVSSRLHLVPCPMCAGSGRGHIRACSLCRGECGLRIAVYPDDTGIAPNWARYHAYLEDEYDGAPDAGPRASAIGCGQTPDEAIADLLERIAP